jgi:branched-subunit amino acid transport protein
MAAVGAGSYAMRVAPLLVLTTRWRSERTDRLLRRSGVAALTALVASSTRALATGTAVAPVLLAMTVGLALARRGSAMPAIVATGMALYAAASAAIDATAG